MSLEKKKPFFLIMLPSYNRPDLVLKAVDSVVSQEYDNYLLHIFNDGSDVSYEKLEALIFDHPKVVYTKSENIGINKARNKMLKDFIDSHGKEYLNNAYFCTLSDDDFFVDDAFKKFELSIQDHPKDIWFSFNCYSLSQHLFENYDFQDNKVISYQKFRDDYHGDKHFLFRLKDLQKNKYPAEYFKNGFEHIFYYSIPSKIRIIPMTVKIIEYQEDGLSLSDLYDSFDNFSIIFAHIKSDPRNKLYYIWMLKKVFKEAVTFPKKSLKKLISEDRYYKIKKNLGLKTPKKYQ